MMENLLEMELFIIFVTFQDYMEIIYLPLIPDQGSRAQVKIKTREHGDYLYELNLTAKAKQFGKEKPIIFEVPLGKTHTEDIKIFNHSFNPTEFTIEVSIYPLIYLLLFLPVNRLFYCNFFFM